MLYRCVCLRETGFFSFRVHHSYEEKRREESQSVTDLNIFLLTPSRSLSPSVSIAWLLHVKLSPSLTRKTRTTTPLVFRFPSLLLISSVFGDGDDRLGRLTHICHVPPSLPLSCVCVCVHLFLIRSDPSRLAVMDYIAPVEKEIKKLRERERAEKSCINESLLFFLKNILFNVSCWIYRMTRLERRE